MGRERCSPFKLIVGFPVLSISLYLLATLSGPTGQSESCRPNAITTLYESAICRDHARDTSNHQDFTTLWGPMAHKSLQHQVPPSLLVTYFMGHPPNLARVYSTNFSCSLTLSLITLARYHVACSYLLTLSICSSIYLVVFT